MTPPAKRAFDLALAAPAWLVSLPLQAVIASVIAATMGRPVLFRQQRAGLHGEPFDLVKFRTMRVPDTSSGLLSDEDRLTRLGSFLRSTSLDELPTLWNVIRNDVGLVGPRPLLMSYLDRYTPEQARRHEVKPGLTGLAQVNGRNAISWNDRLAWDVAYVDNHSLAGDVRIIAQTLRLVLHRDGITADGSATMPEFTG